MKNYFKNKTVLITGGTGSFGNSFVNYFISKKIQLKKIIVYSRDEFKQFEMAKEYPVEKYPFMRYFIGDVRDKDRLNRALNGVDIVIHAAALKQVPKAEYNPNEYIKTNILGSQNVIDASIKNSVKKVIALSTDKAAAPANLYGATKLCSDKLFSSANNIVGSQDIRFSVVRYGNVLGSRGSILPFLLKQKKENFFTITDENMTRFNITLDQGVDFVLWVIENMKGKELFVPKIPSYKILDLAKAIQNKLRYKIIGIRPGEKIHEELITASDSFSTIENKKMYIILPSNLKNINVYKKNFHARKITEGFSYNSGNNSNFLTVEQIKKIINSAIF